MSGGFLGVLWRCNFDDQPVKRTFFSMKNFKLSFFSNVCTNFSSTLCAFLLYALPWLHESWVGKFVNVLCKINSLKFRHKLFIFHPFFHHCRFWRDFWVLLRAGSSHCWVALAEVSTLSQARFNQTAAACRSISKM